MASADLGRSLLGVADHLRGELVQVGHLLHHYGPHPATWGRVIAWAWRHDRAAVNLIAGALLVGLPLAFWALSRLSRAAVLMFHRIKQGAGPRRDPTHIFLGEGDGKLESFQDEEGVQRLRLPPGEVYIPEALESSHILIAGMSGTGKTQLFLQILNALDARRARGDDARGVVLDLKGDFLQHYYREGDALFNPLDARSVGWCPFAELRPNTLQLQSDLDALASAIKPPNPHAGQNAFFDKMSRAVIRDIIEALYLSKENPSNADLQRIFFGGVSPREIYRLLEVLPLSQARDLFAPGGDDRTRSNVWSSVLASVQMLRLLNPKTTKRDGFSFRRWGVEGKAGQWLFLSRRVEDEELLGDQYATLISLVALGQMSVPDNRARPVHYILDELAQAGVVSALERMMTFGRSKKASAVIGIQSYPQLVKNYGHDEASIIVGNAGTVAVLRQGDSMSGEFFADLLGKERSWRDVASHSKAGESSKRERFDEYHYTPTNLTNLRSLSEKGGPGQGLVRERDKSGKHPRPGAIRVVWMGDRIPSERVPDFVPGGEEISWTPEAVAGRQGEAHDTQARDSDKEAWARMERDAKAERERRESGQRAELKAQGKALLAEARGEKSRPSTTKAEGRRETEADGDPLEALLNETWARMERDAKAEGREAVEADDDPLDSLSA